MEKFIFKIVDCKFNPLQDDKELRIPQGHINHDNKINR